MQYYALSGLGEFDSGTRGDALRACPWLSYSAPSALDLPLRPTFEAKPLRLITAYFTFTSICLGIAAVFFGNVTVSNPSLNSAKILLQLMGFASKVRIARSEEHT